MDGSQTKCPEFRVVSTLRRRMRETAARSCTDAYLRSHTVNVRHPPIIVCKVPLREVPVNEGVAQQRDNTRTWYEIPAHLFRTASIHEQHTHLFSGTDYCCILCGITAVVWDHYHYNIIKEGTGKWVLMLRTDGSRRSVQCLRRKRKCTKSCMRSRLRLGILWPAE